MAYIAQTHLAPAKTFARALEAIPGLGRHQCLQICDQLGTSPNIRVAQLSPGQIQQAAQLVLQNYDTGRDARRGREQNVARLVKIASYRGFRHVAGLPVRGQRTHGNARTARRIRVAPRLSTRA